MDARLQPLAAILELDTKLLRNCVRDLTDAQAGHRLAGGGNSIAFLVAHMADARYYLAGLLGAPLDNPLAPALADASSVDDVVRMPLLVDLLAAWDTVSRHLSEVFPGLTASVLDAPSPLAIPIAGGTVLQTVTFLAQHESYHLGQVSFLRRQIGLPAMRYD